MRIPLAAALMTTALMTTAAPAAAAWTTTSPDVRAAANEPRVAAVLAATTRLDAALVAGDMATFAAVFADDAAINSPQNTINRPAAAKGRFAAGLIAYVSYDRVIDFAGVRPGGEVVIMGEERLVPRDGAPNAGKTVRRRFTDVWRDEAGTWKLAVRQATIVAVE